LLLIRFVASLARLGTLDGRWFDLKFDHEPPCRLLACMAIMPLLPTKTFKTWRQRVKLIDSINAGNLSTRGAGIAWGIQEKMLQNWRKNRVDEVVACFSAAEASCRWTRFLKSRSDHKERAFKTDEAYMLQLAICEAAVQHRFNTHLYVPVGYKSSD
jgi:hypothetical protein